MSALRVLETELARVLSDNPDVKAKFGNPVRLVSGEAARAAYPFIRFERHEVRSRDPSGQGPDEHRISVDIISRSGGRTEAGDLVALVLEVLRSANRSLSGYRIVLLHPVFSDVFQLRDGISHRGALRLKVLIEPN